MRVGGSAIGILVAVLLVPADMALAANQNVAATVSSTFDPDAVTVNVGEMVTWSNQGGLHNVHFDDNSFVQPSMADLSMWSVSRSFTVPGSFRYYCDQHGGPGGSGMAGTVNVVASGAPPPGPGGGGPAPPPVSADKVAPGVKLSGRRRQAAVRRRAVSVTVSVNEASTVSAQGTISVPRSSKVFRLKKVSRKLAAGARATLELKLPKQGARALRRALARGFRLSAKLTVTAKDAAGNTKSAQRTVRLKR